jgi:hypothetical protein
MVVADDGLKMASPGRVAAWPRGRRTTGLNSSRYFSDKFIPRHSMRKQYVLLNEVQVLRSLLIRASTQREREGIEGG